MNNTPESETKKGFKSGNDKLIKARAKSDSAAVLMNSLNRKKLCSDSEMNYSNRLEKGVHYSSLNKPKHLTNLSNHSPQHHSTLQRPRVPPPPLPAHQVVPIHQKIRNGRSSENLYSLSHENAEYITNRTMPIPPPRKVYTNSIF